MIKLQGHDVGNCTKRGFAKGSYCVVQTRSVAKYKRICPAYLCTTSQEKKPFVKNGFTLFANTGKILLLPRVPLYGLFVITLISRTNAYTGCSRLILNQFIERFGLGRSVPTAKPLHPRAMSVGR